MHEDEMAERVSDDEGHDADDAMMQEDDNGDNRGSGQQQRPRNGRDVPDDEPPLEGYER
jgi:hypothetical protein